MKPVTVDMLRAHLPVASLTAVGTAAAPRAIRRHRELNPSQLRLTGKPFVLPGH